MAKSVVKVGIGLVVVGGIATAVATTHASPTLGFPHPPPAHAEVAAVVDAETVDVRADDQVTRVRLGHIAPPEPLAPGFPVVCLQSEAEAQLRSILPSGTQLTLTYDTDRFGRTVAEATTADGRLVNAELVRAGLAEAVGDSTNAAAPPAINDAAQDALTNKRGMHAADIPCTVPGQVKILTDKVAAIPTSVPTGAGLTTLVAAANRATETRMVAETLASGFAEVHQDAIWSALDASERAELEGQVEAAVDKVVSDERVLRAATNVTVNQQATDSASQREHARIAKALAEIRKAELQRAAQAAHREEEARKAQAAVAEQARREAERARNADPSQSARSGDSSRSDSSSSGSSDSSQSGRDSGSHTGSSKKKNSSSN